MKNEKKNLNWITYSFSDTLTEEAKKNKKIIVLDADLSDDINLKKFQTKFPNRFIQNGIAEQDMVSMAGGLALMGLLPVVNSFASFLTSRANEQIYNNCTENSKIIYISLYAGLLPAGAGKSHQSLRDISLLSNIPNFKIFHPSNNYEARNILKYCIRKEKYSCAIRLNIGPPPIENFKFNKKKFILGKGEVLQKGNKLAIFTYGQTMTSVVFKLNKILLKNKIRVKIVNFPSLNFFNKKWLIANLKSSRYLFLIDDHHSNGGFADLITSFLVNQNINKNLKIKKICINEFPACGAAEEVLSYHKLDEISLYKLVKNIYKNIRI
jgi:transketolase